MCWGMGWQSLELLMFSLHLISVRQRSRQNVSNPCAAPWPERTGPFSKQLEFGPSKATAMRRADLTSEERQWIVNPLAPTSSCLLWESLPDSAHPANQRLDERWDVCLKHTDTQLSKLIPKSRLIQGSSLWDKDLEVCRLRPKTDVVMCGWMKKGRLDGEIEGSQKGMRVWG